MAAKPLPEPPMDSEFLKLIHADPREAEKGYLQLRRKLICFFRQRGRLDLEDLADEVIQRAYRKWREGVEVEKLGAYCYGIARYVLMEAASSASPTELSEETQSAPFSADESILLQELLGRLEPRDCALIVAYHGEDRKELAVRLGLTENALRIRAHRIVKSLRSLAERRGKGPKEGV